MKKLALAILQTILVVSLAPKSGHGQSLSPPAINIAQGKKIQATATCGEDVGEPELFCKLATVAGKFEILGLSCDHCDPSVSSKNHSIQHAIDGTEKWWQSPPLSRGLQYQRVNITIDLGQEYQVAYVIIKTGNAPRPGTWALEKSVDGGKTFTPWQYFATDNSDCLTYFGHSALLQSFKDDTTVTCTTSYSQVPPFENGEIHISLVNGRPGASNFSYSQALQEWTRATHIRLRLLKVKTLLTDLLPLARKDPSVTRRYFYSIKDISVGGICMCNGHADACVQLPGESQFRCSCKHQTCGVKCEECCPGFVQKKWRPATAESSNECEPCNCHNHAIDCYYSERIAQEKRSLDINGNYEGGGVCVNCQHNTYGINCESCKPGYYRPTGVPKTSPDACQACTCDRRFSTGRCFDGDGRCECLENYSGPNCDQCNEGFYGFPNCKPCDCHPLGTSGRVCGPSGDQCPCKPNYTGAKCDQCAPGYYGFPDCRRCNCDTVGSLSSDCEITSGQCNCRQMYTGRQCNQCSRGFYSFPECKVCNCDGEGTDHDICDPNTGVCICMKNFAGPRCDVCNEGYYGFPECKACGCSAEGSVSPKCNQAGVCECKENYDVTTTKKCDRCRVGYYSYPRCVKCSCDPRGSVHQFCDPETGQCTCKGSFRGLNCNRCRSGYYGFPDCQRCQCNPAGIKPLPDGQLVDCSLSNEGQCNCKDNVQGLACTECKDGYYFLQSSNPLGCNNCDCNMDGVIGGLRTCDKFTGQCPCKLYVAGRKCTSCKAGFYGLAGSKVFGCTGCDCDVGGAYNQFCDITSGQCMCRPNVVGRDCSRPAPRHYYPTLFHTVAELEDATAVPTKQGSVPGQDVLSPDVSPDSEGTPARFGFDESKFPGYSWRGYATMSDLQRALKVTLDIPKTARYHLIFHSITNESSPVTGKVMLTPKGGSGSKQSSPVTFPVKQVGSANVPTHHTVGDKGMVTQFMLTKGQWDLMLVLPPASVLLDYVTALPQEYYEAYRLEDKVTKPCQVNGINTLCNQFSYLSTNKPRLFTTELETGYIIRTGGKLTQTQLFKDEAALQQLDFSAMALLDDAQNRVTADFKIPKSGKYVFVLQYYHPSDSKAKLSVYLRYPQGTQQGEFNLQRCNFRFGCRQVAVESNGAVKVFDVPRIQRMVVTLLTRDSSSPMALDSITAIPLDMWSLDYIAPSILCTTQGSVCIPTSYPNPKGAVKIEADDTDPSDPQPPNKQDPSVKLQYLKGPKIHVLTGPVPRPGQYAAIVHYYQPNHASFDSRVTVTSDRALDGSMKFHYCPHASGCRSVVRDLNASPFFNIGRSSVALEFNIPENASTWIDYVLLVPQAAFTEELQEDAPVPLTQAFLDSCSKDDFFIKPSDPQFCKDSVFSLTTAFINGSLSCDCNLKGSLNSDCQQYGGQCPCRPNVIGRTCSRCKTGYYGFPNCRKCRCVFCNEITGACDCPPNTVGPNCEFCLQGTCCYDPILGCQDCGCERFGVKGGDIACSASTGQCNCKPSHTGKKCNKCATGYYNYPLCQKCDSCDPRGVDSRICNSDDGTCFCKPGVTGPRCDQCAAGRFNLDANNPDGCSECWCNGLSDTCDSGDKYWSKVDTMDNWQLENSPAIVVKIGETNLFASISSQRDEKGKPIYWLAPKEFLGQKISSYGGKLSYTTRYEVPQGEGSPVLTTKPDVVIEGKNGKVLSYRTQLQLSPGKTSSFELQFLEYLWVDASGANVSRDDFMSVLSDIQSLKLRASYSTVVAEVTLNDVKMDVAVDGPLAGAAWAKSVEMCECPERATGASCELCGKGFTRAADNTTCVPCNCFGHSDDCDGETGICNNCLHNTTGPDCGECELGYYGDATVGSEQDCRICECPLGIMSNSFATECALDPFRDLSCKCQEGYEGRRCEKCADGFYGNPSQPGDYCKRCYCSGNIDTSVNGSCDTQTGQCLKCINAATGDQCDRCLDGYFGDAVVAKNCARCACSDCGTVTAVCNHTTGACKCKPNVIGDSCDSCTPNTWNFDSCLGCEDCACAPASLSASCDVKTGQCECPEGVTGRQCDRCKAGFFGYSAAGCQPCNCPKGEENLFGFCDVNTGQCCKPGGNCTICPYNYILTAEGCEYCGECVERLLNTSTELDRKLTQALKSLEQGTAGIIAEGRFQDINETLQRLIPPTNEYNTTMEEVHMLVGVSSVAVNSSSTDIAGSGLTKRTESSEAATERVEQIVRKLTERAIKASENATSTKDEALTLEEEIKDALNRTRDVISFAERIANTLKTDKANQTLLLEEAEEILKELVNRNFGAANATMAEEEELVMSAMNRAKSMLNDTVSLWSQLMDANKTLSELLGKFGSILDKTSSVLENTSLALETNNISKSYDSEMPLRDAGKNKQEVDIALMSLMDVIETTKSKLFNGSSSLQSFNGSFPRLDDLIDQVTKRMANISQTMDELVPSVVMAQNHSDELRKQADELDKLLTDIEFANKAVNASQRYSAIADALKEALAIAQEAEEIAMDARDESQNVSNLARNSQNVSSELNESAIQTKEKVDKELSSLLDDIKNRLDLIRRKIQNVSEDLNDVTENFDEFEEMANVISEKSKELGENATQSQKVADDAWEKADEIDKQLVGLSGLKESIIATNSNITEAEDKVMDALNTSKVIKDKVVVQELRQEKIIEQLDTEVVQRLNDIRQMMDQAHVLLKHTSIVMKFDGKTSSSPLLPQAVQRDTRSLNFLTYIKPEKPDGLVLFMGDAQGSNRKKRQSQVECGSDFIAVELKASKPILKMCTSGKFLDYGAKKDILTDGKRWYKLQAGMTGNLATMSITHYDETQKKTVSENLPARGLRMVNPMMMFNKQSDLVVGGVPRNMKLPPQVDAVNYTGCFDGLQINDHFVGSWNSDPLEISPNVPIEDRYCFSRSGDAGFAAKANDPSRTFFGTGFLKSGPYSAEDIMGDLSFKFKTTSSNGILVIGIDDDDTSLFQAMELSDGHVTFKYNMGSGFRWLYSKNVYDTGDEVTIEKTTNIFGDRFDLIISSSQGQEVLAKDLPVYKGATRAPSWVNADYVYWGGIANRTSIPANVTKSFFKGCLTDLRLNNGDVKIQASPGFVLGCQVKPAYNVTLLKDHSYLSIKPFLDTRRRGFNIGLSFRVPPRTKSGLLFLEAHDGSRDFIILGLVEGKLTFSASTGGVPLTLQTTNKLNDGKWHFVSVQKDGIIIHLYVDRTKISGEFQDEMQQYIQTTQDMYLGGVPTDYMDTVRNRDFQSVILNSLKGGSIRDLTFEDDLFNFMDYKARNDVIFDNDDYSEQTPKNLFIETTVSPRTTALPIGEIKSTPRSQTTTEVQSTTPESTTTTMPSTTESTTTTMPSTTERVTTTPPPTTTTPPPTTQPPVCPMPDTPAQQTGVMGFGHDPYSHAVYTITKDSPLNKLISTRTRLSFEFRASNPNGILLYTANPTQADFIECHLEEGKVSCSFSAGGGILALTSPQNSYSDGNWHNVRLMRREKNGTLSVNGKKVATGKADGSPTFINSLSVVYVGGTPDDFDTKRVTPASRISFPGCIRNITVNNLDIGEPTTKIKTQNCYQDSPSRGVLFSDGGGFLEAADRYSVGRDEIIKLEIKPTSHTGLLLSSFSAKGDYIVLEMIRGNLIFRAENGGGQLVVEYAADNPLDLCDGQWHTVQAWKESNVVRLQVDDGAILEGGGKGSQTGADIFDPLYVGGLPDEVKDDNDKLKKTGVTATEPFTGCIRNLESKEPGQKAGKTLRLANPLDMSGNVFLGGCPYN